MQTTPTMKDCGKLGGRGGTAEKESKGQEDTTLWLAVGGWIDDPGNSVVWVVRPRLRGQAWEGPEQSGAHGSDGQGTGSNVHTGGAPPEMVGAEERQRQTVQ